MLNINSVTKKITGDTLDIDCLVRTIEDANDIIVSKKDLKFQVWTDEETRQSIMGLETIEYIIMACIFKAMATKQNIMSSYPADPVFLSNMRFYQKRMISRPENPSPEWKDRVEFVKSHLREVTLVVPEAKMLGSTNKRKVGVFVSGGIDSTYTLITNPTVTDGIRITSMNNQKDDSIRIAQMLRPNLRIHVVNVPHYDTRAIHQDDAWFVMSHGTIVAAAGLLFQNILSGIYVSSSNRNRGCDCGTGHDVDYLFSTSRMRFMTYGFLRHKANKVRAIKAHPMAEEIFKYLQVCPIPKAAGVVNCSDCEKCLINMRIIKDTGCEELAKTFDWTNFESRFEKAKNSPFRYDRENEPGVL